MVWAGYWGVGCVLFYGNKKKIGVNVTRVAYLNEFDSI